MPDQPNTVLPINEDELNRLTSCIKELTTHLHLNEMPDYETPEGREVALQTASQMHSTALTFESTAETVRKSGNTGCALSLSKVASSFERMNSGFKNIAEGNKALNVAGKMTTLGKFNVTTGVLSVAAGALSLIGDDSPNYNGPLSEIHSEINGLRQEFRDGLRQVAQVLEGEILTVGRMVSQVMANQQILLNAVNQALDGIDQIKSLLTEHMQTTDAMHAHLATKDLREAHSKMQRYLSGKLLSKEGIPELLDRLVFLFSHELKSTITNESKLKGKSSESMLTLFNQQSSLNLAAVITARLRDLFGDDILDEKYTTLPSLDVYQSTVALFLLGVNKSQLFSQDACEFVCTDIQKTFQLYSEFVKELRSNTRLWQALFDLYNSHRDKYGRILFASKLTQKKESNETLHELEEIRLLLCHLLTWIDGSQAQELNRRVLALSSAEQIRQNPRHTTIALSTKAEHYRMELRSGSIALGVDKWSQYLTTPATQGCFKNAVDTLLINLIQKPINQTADPYFSFSYSPLSQYEAQPYELKPIPIPTEFRVQTITSTISNDCKWSSSSAYSSPISLNATKEITIPSAYTSSMCLLYLGGTRAPLDYMMEATPDRRLVRIFNGNTNSYYNFNVPSSVRTQIIKCPVFPDNTSPNDIARHELPSELNAILKHFKAEDPSCAEHPLQVFFNYYVFSYIGQLKEAAAVVLNQPSLINNKNYLLFLVAILGRWDIFENFISQFPLPVNFDYVRIVEGGSLTPLMIAAQHGREDVVNALLAKMKPADIARQSFDKKTAAQLAFEQGFYKIAHQIKQGLTAEEIQACKDNIPVDLAPAILTNPLTLAFGNMKNVVERFKADFKLQADAKSRELAAAEPKAVSYETDDDGEAVLNEITAEIVPTAPAISWRKPVDPQHQKTGERKLPISIFINKRQEQRLKGELQNHALMPVPDVIDGENCLKVVVKREVTNKR